MVAGAVLALLPMHAHGEKFLGWSKDGSFYLTDDGDGGLSVCLTNEVGPAPKFPKGWRMTSIPCTPICGEPSPVQKACRRPKALVAAIRRRVVPPPAPAARGPHGETVVVRLVKSGYEVMLEPGDGKKLAWGSSPKARVTDVFWRPDGRAVAFSVEDVEGATPAIYGAVLPRPPAP